MGYLFYLALTPAIFDYWVVFLFKTIFASSVTRTALISKYVKFPTQAPKQKFKNGFSLLGSQEIGSSFVSF